MTYYPDGSMEKYGEVIPGERHSFDFEAMTVRFENPIFVLEPFAAAPAPVIEGTPAEGEVLTAQVNG